MRKTWGGLVAVAAALAVTLSGCASDIRNTPVDTLSSSTELKALASEFDAGLIVGDQQFYDAHSLSVDGIQSFIEQVPCTPKDESKCLSKFAAPLPAIEADQDLAGHCEAITPIANARASEIIASVAVACGVSPKMLLVLMQKEQSLLTKPSVYGYQRATGYGCPDSTGCDSKYYGFVNQVYLAAWQFRQYTQQPDRQFQIGSVDIGYNPEPACGQSEVTIVNQATANLYNYTPYQPNKAALADPAGEGDACSAWGNLNVWLLWNVWFGDPLDEPLPAYLPDCVTHTSGARCQAYNPSTLFN